MGNDLEAGLCYGVSFSEYVEMPWHERDIDEWWAEVHNYVPLYTPFTQEGNYADGWCGDDPRFTEYYGHKRAWLEENPCPVECVYAGIYECCDTILIQKGAKISTYWAPSSIDVQKLPQPDTSVKDFIVKYMPDMECDEPSWFLYGFYG